MVFFIDCERGVPGEIYLMSLAIGIISVSIESYNS